jgi:hypothetical protein
MLVTPHAEELGRALAYVHACGTAPGERWGSRPRLQALFGSWIAERAGIPAPAEALGELAMHARDTLASEDRRGAFDARAHDPRLLLLCRDAMRSRGVASAVLEHSCGELPSAPPPHALRLPDGPDLLLRADAATIRTVCNGLAAATRFGAEPLPQPQAAALRLPLAARMLQTLRDYDLVLGTSLLRTLVYLGAGPGDDDVEDAIAHLLCQQQPDGRFGWYARELRSCDPPLDADRDLHLPVTVAILWALVEASTPGFSLALPLGARL